MSAAKSRRKNRSESDYSDEDDESFTEDSVYRGSESDVLDDDDFVKQNSRQPFIRSKKDSRSPKIDRRQTRKFNSSRDSTPDTLAREDVSNVAARKRRKNSLGEKSVVGLKSETVPVGRRIARRTQSTRPGGKDASVSEVESTDDSEEFEVSAASDEDDDLEYGESNANNIPGRKGKQLPNIADSRQTRRSPRRAGLSNALDNGSTEISRRKNNKKKRSISLFGNDSSEASESIRQRILKESPVQKNARKSTRIKKPNSKSGATRINLLLSSEPESPRRQSSTRMLGMASYKESSDSEDGLRLPMSLASNRKKIRSKRFQDDDEEFIPNEVDDAQGSECNSSEVSLADSIAHAADVGRVGYVEENVGDTDDSDLEIESPRQGRKPIEPRRKDDDSDEQSTDNGSEKFVTTSPCIPACPSTEDAITFEPLPTLHVCLFTPDNKDRHCFCLSTLRKIAMSTSRPMFRHDLTGGKQTFLQPPHFRTPISDDLLDQIASRFGREALDIHGPYYHRPQETNFDGDDLAPEVPISNISRFNDQVRRYVESTMGSRDLYACPLCYIVAHRNLTLSMKTAKQKKK